MGRSPIRTRGNEKQASSVARAGRWRTGRDQKSPLRRCFKPRPSWRTRCAGFASGCQSSVRSSGNPVTLRSSRSRSGRLSGLLSGCPPIDTRPQARAKLGKPQISDFRRPCKSFARLVRVHDQKNSRIVLAVLTQQHRTASRAPFVALFGRGERLDSHAVAHEGDHHRDAAGEEDHLEHVDADVAEAHEVGERPAAGEGGAEHLGADQHGSTEHRDDALPHDAAAGGSRLRHGVTLVSGGNIPEMDCRIKAETATKSRRPAVHGTALDAPPQASGRGSCAAASITGL